ncbi:DUF1810 family protein [Cyanobium sp. Aljojuca 7D2]|uniref:DUF1810 family protein n=1 Tax=Cyanobium sp. Aljojuca 7D2 TaxID=2823698 RepID=UPI0020CED427|nr:DUF1810 family protein [Cyanobium sp. Aljojuca 7D2]MCP9891418.1 DUF1810 family protein [Cyanobium sp. Aljojuca 7D2]
MHNSTGGLDRFCTAQNAGNPSAIDQALGELRTGCKRSHWIWFVLPQLAGLGHSEMAQRYGIAGLVEARAYLAEPLLRQRLEAVISVIHHQLQQYDQTLERLMGSELDTTKTISSLTLFEAAGLARATTLLNHLGRRCAWTQTQLNASATKPPA